VVAVLYPFPGIAKDAIYTFPEFAAAGGLISYATSLADSYRQTGIYAAASSRARKRATYRSFSPQNSSWINLKTAKALGLTVPPNLLAIADEVIE
jgi:putative tryptophan/tyrosine transport system substrate-binding protein